MDVIVSCPACRFSVSVPEEDVLTARILCRRCRHVFGPLGPDVPPPAPPKAPPPPAYPKIPAYTAPVKAAPPRRRPSRPVLPADGPAAERLVPVRRMQPAHPAGADEIPVAAPARPRRSALRWWAAGAAVALFGLFGLLVAGTAGRWLFKRANGEGEWVRHTLPDAPGAELEFPIPPAAANEPVSITNEATGQEVGRKSLPLFKCELPNGETYAVRTETVSWETVRATSALRLRQEHLLKIPKLVLGADPRQFRQRSTPTAGYPSDECFVPLPDGRGYVFRVLQVDERMFTLFVSGPGVTTESPRAVRFFDSFRHAHVPPEDAAEPPAEPPGAAPEPDALRLLARVPPHDAAVFAPRQNAVFLSAGPNPPYRSDIHPETWAPVKPLRIAPEGIRPSAPAHLMRYHYPSFRPEAAAPLATTFTAVAVDGAGERVRGWSGGERQGGAREPVGDVTYPAPEPRPGWDAPSAWARPPEPIRHHPAGVTFASGGRLLSADRTRLYSIAGTVPHLDSASGRKYSGGLIRALNYPALTPRSEATVPGARGGVALSPDGTRMYVLAGPAPGRPAGVAVVELDADNLRVLREARIRSDVAHVVVIGDGRVIGFGFGTPRPEAVRRYALAALIDLSADPPRERLIDVWGKPDRHLRHGDRLYTLGGEELSAFDLSAAAAGRVRRLNVAPTKGTEMALSPDGKCLVVNDGCVYWVGGAGPLPPVDPGARW